MTKVQELFLQYSSGLESISDQELIFKFNRQIGNGGWGVARSAYLAALRRQLEKREIDYSAIENSQALSYKHHIFLVDKKLFLLDSLPLNALGDLVSTFLKDIYPNLGMKVVNILGANRNEIKIELNVFPFIARLTSNELVGIGSNS